MLKATFGVLKSGHITQEVSQRRGHNTQYLYTHPLPTVLLVAPWEIFEDLRFSRQQPQASTVTLLHSNGFHTLRLMSTTINYNNGKPDIPLQHAEYRVLIASIKHPHPRNSIFETDLTGPTQGHDQNKIDVWNLQHRATLCCSMTTDAMHIKRRIKFWYNHIRYPYIQTHFYQLGCDSDQNMSERAAILQKLCEDLDQNIRTLQKWEENANTHRGLWL